MKNILKMTVLGLLISSTGQAASIIKHPGTWAKSVGRKVDDTAHKAVEIQARISTFDSIKRKEDRKDAAHDKDMAEAQKVAAQKILDTKVEEQELFLLTLNERLSVVEKMAAVFSILDKSNASHMKLVQIIMQSTQIDQASIQAMRKLAVEQQSELLEALTAQESEDAALKEKNQDLIVKIRNYKDQLEGMPVENLQPEQAAEWSQSLADSSYEIAAQVKNMVTWLNDELTAVHNKIEATKEILNKLKNK